ncbi:trypsin-like serine protease [Candidatus Falkowbacteria bacterium]|jgi:serine protease Do|nr:trypsin-like serine protease [Candidatus Falkowbacteria bacterium]MBT7007697.1 trypsin-like serine protease [Candidatus Falkowbacteria bacterium]
MHKLSNQLLILILLSLIVGAVGGAFGSFFLKPYLENTSWGRSFLQTNIANQVNSQGDDTVISITEDSPTIEVVKKASPAVVSIVATKELESYYDQTGPSVLPFFFYDEPNSSGKREVATGSGFVFDESGLVLTNRHVVEDEAADYTVILNDGTEYKATVLGRDLVLDIAVLKIEATDLAVIELGDSDNIQIGQTVIAIGNALGEYNNTVTRGVVSGIDRRVVASDSFGSAEVLDSAIQTDAAINPGNSGGPLLNISGQVIGINTAINAQGSSLGFAIPINKAKTIVTSVLENGRIVRPWLGVRYVEINESIAEKNGLSVDYGSLIIRGDSPDALAVVEDSPADKAGLAEGDIIVEVNNQQLDDTHSLVNEIAKYKPGDEVELKVVRDGEEMIVKVKLEEREE